MKNTRFNLITNYPFVICLFLLIFNDFYLKCQFHNAFTGKLSDFAGLFIFPLFISAFFSKKYSRTIHVLVALFFVFWKSEYANTFINLLNNIGFSCERIVDFSDNIALISVFLAYYFQEKLLNYQLKLNAKWIIIGSLFAFTSTTLPRNPHLEFKNSTYRVYTCNKPLEFSQLVDLTNKTIEDNSDGSFYLIKIVKFDTLNALIIVKFNGIETNFKDKIKDSYQDAYYKNKAYDLLNLNNEDFQPYLYSYKTEIENDLTLEKVEFKNSRLNGSYYFKSENIVKKGNYENGLEHNWWYTFENNKLISKTLYQKGEEQETINYKNGVAETESNFTRFEYLIYLFVLFILWCVIGVFSIFKIVKTEQFVKLTGEELNVITNSSKAILLSFLTSFLSGILIQFEIEGIDIFQIIGLGVINFIIGMFYYLIFIGYRFKHQITYLYMVLIYLSIFQVFYIILFYKSI